MLTPDEAEAVGTDAEDAASSMETALLVAIASAVVAAVTPQQIIAQATALARDVAAIVRSGARSIVEAMSTSLHDASSRIVASELSNMALDEAKRRAIKTSARATTLEAVTKAQRQIESATTRMARNANKAYIQKAYQAAAMTTSGMKTREQATRTVIGQLASRGISSYTYTRSDGTVVNVPVDVGVRRILGDSFRSIQDAETEAILKLTDSDLVEVSSHPGARPSHAEWQGEVYSYFGRSGKYKDFRRACNVGDLVNGYGGYNCRHTMGIYHEGSPRRFERDPSPKGYTNDEVYELRQKQRGYENAIRKLSREVAVLDSQGFDTTVERTRIRLKQDEIRRMVDAHPKVLRREGWREQAVAPTHAARYKLDENRKPLKSGRYSVKQRDIDEIIRRDLPNVRIPCEVVYNPHLGTYGRTQAKELWPGRIKVTRIEIGPQRYPTEAELRDTVIHEVLEAKHLARDDRRLAGGDAVMHPRIDRIIAKYVKMKGL